MAKKNIIIAVVVVAIVVVGAILWSVVLPPTTVAPTVNVSGNQPMVGEEGTAPVVPPADDGSDKTAAILQGLDGTSLGEGVAGDFTEVDSDLKGL